MPPAKKPGSQKRRQRKSPPQTSPPEAPEEEAGSSADSARASEKDSPANGFVADAGPAFEPGDDEGPPEAGGAADLHVLESEVAWDEQALGGLLRAKGQVLHSLAGVGERDWEYTDADIAAIAPPLARILNRYPATKAAAGSADPLALTIAASAMVARSMGERRAVLAELEAEEEHEEPVTGVPASPGSGPPPGHPAAAAVGPTPPTPAPAAPDETIDPNAVEWQKP